MRLDLQSERFAATGNLTGAGIGKSLGAPSLNKLRVLVREACQNSWDARASSSEVGFRIHVRQLTTKQHSSLNEALHSRPRGGDTRHALAKSLDDSPPWILEIADSGTRGLSGPVRADLDEDHDQSDFVSFFRNIGSPRDQRLGGGTYGYGKSSLYNFSHCRTILAYSQTMNGSKPVVRLMASAIGHPYREGGHFTGRHWWGERELHQRIVDPLTREPAHRLAHSLGMDRRSADNTGTTIMVLDPDFGDRSPAQVANSIVECLTWYFWPKMLPSQDGMPAMRFEVMLDGTPVHVPEPAEMPPVGLLAQAMMCLKTQSHPPGVHRIQCGRPKKDLGTLALVKGPRRQRLQLDTGEEDPLIPEHCSHVALMRPAELVVKYLERPRIPSDMLEFAGAFVCDEDVEQHFADSEPPAHDDWLPASLHDPGKRFVGTALRHIRETVDEFANPITTGTNRPAQTSMAKIADIIGGVVIGQDGGALGGGHAPSRTPGNRRAKAPSELQVSEPESFRLAMVRRTPCALFVVRIAVPAGMHLRAHADPLVVMDGGVTAPPSGNDTRIVAWLTPNGDPLTNGADAQFTGPGQFAPLVAVSVNPDAAVSVAIRTEADTD